MLTDGFLFNHSLSFFHEFDQRRRRHYPLEVSTRTRRTVNLSPEIIEAAKQRGMSLGDYILQLHLNQRSSRVAYVASLYRGFALLEMARVLELEPTLVPKRLVPAVQALIGHAAGQKSSTAPDANSIPLVGGVPEDAENDNA